MKIKRPRLSNRGFQIIVLFALQQGDLGCVIKETEVNVYFGVTNKSAMEYPF